MTTYHKVIEIADTGQVFAKVFCSEDGRRVGFAYWEPSFIEGFTGPSIEKIEARADLAHNWADDYMAMCRRNEHLKP
jgi:hypothetical protein